MKTSHTQTGYIMIVTLMVVSLAFVLVAYMINRGTVYLPLTKTVIDREKSKELAFAGLQMAMSQLAYADVVEKEEKRRNKKTCATSTRTKSTSAGTETKRKCWLSWRKTIFEINFSCYESVANI